LPPLINTLSGHVLFDVGLLTLLKLGVGPATKINSQIQNSFFKLCI